MIINITEANPGTDVPACLGKRRFEIEHRSTYYCVWCDGWHQSRHAGRPKGKTKPRRGQSGKNWGRR